MQSFETTIAKFDDYGPPVHPNEAHTQGKMRSVAAFVIDQFCQNGELVQGSWLSEMAILSIAGAGQTIDDGFKVRLIDAVIGDDRHLDTRQGDDDRLEFQFDALITPGTTALSLPWAVARGTATQKRSIVSPIEKALTQLTDVAHLAQLSQGNGSVPNLRRKRLGNILRDSGVQDPTRHWHRGVWEWMTCRDDRFTISDTKPGEVLKVSPK